MEGKPKPEKCDSCNTPLGIQKRKSKREFKRRVIDPISNKLLVMCNACGLRLSRAGWRNKKEPVKVTVPVSKETCLKEFEVFTKAVCSVLQDNNADRLYCPAVTPKLCQCIQRYLIFGLDNRGKDVQQLLQGSVFESINKDKASELYELHKRAKQLIKLKAPKPIDRTLTTNELKGCVKLRTKEYEQFVLINRERLKKMYNLCERGIQRVLCYSNNYLHKQLKSTPNCESRIASKSVSVAKLLPDVKSLSEEKCCNRRCTRLAITHERLIEMWRGRALVGQRDARAVLAEMLTPAGGAVNCSKFLQLVTGCSPGLLAKVQKDMKQSAGIREPPEHGLREYWRRKKINAARNRNNCINSSRSTNIRNARVRASDISSTDSFAYSVVNKSNIDASLTTDNPLQDGKQASLRRSEAEENFEHDTQVPNGVCDNDFQTIKCTGNNYKRCNENVDLNSSNQLNETVVQNLFNDNYQESNKVLSLSVTPCENINLSDNQNCNNASEINLVQSVLTSTVASSTQETTISTKHINGDEVNNDGEQVQFIEITKLSTNDVHPTRMEETVPVQSVIILTPGCLLLNDSLIVST